MSSLTAQKGKGFFQDLRKRIVNTLSGRKTIRKQLFKARELSKENEERKKALTRKLKKTKEEKQELSILTAKKAPKEAEYRAEEKKLLEARSPQQKEYNKEYEKKVTVYYPTTSYPFYKGNDRRNATIDNEEFEMIKTIAEAYKSSTKEITYDSRTGAPVNPTTGAIIDAEGKYPEIAPTPLEFIKEGRFSYENTRNGKRRVLAYLYDQMTGVDTEAEGYLFETKHATPEQMVELSLKSIAAYARHEGDQDAISQELFHLPLGELDRQIQRIEKVDWVIPTMEDPSKLVIGQAFGGDFGRYMSTCKYPRSIEYQFDEERNYCTLQAGEDVPAKPPIQSFNSPSDKYLCIGCFGDLAHFSRWHARNLKGMSNYIILSPKYLPIPDNMLQSAANPVRIQASGFLECTFLHDAFKEQAVNTMDEDLFNLIKKNAPKLIEAAKVIIGTLSYLKKTPFQKLFTERFLLLAEEFFPEEMAISYRNPFVIPEVNSAMKRKRGFLFCDPYTAYCAKKKEPKVWHETFGAKFSATGEFYNVAFSVYNELNDIEKFLVDFYQFAYILERLQLRNNSGITNVKLLQASDIYKMPINSPEFIEFIRDNSGPRDEMFKEFLKMQKLVITYAKPITSSADIFRFLQKFARMPVSFPGTNVNIENTKYMNTYFRHQRGMPEANGSRRLEIEENEEEEEERPRISERPLLSLRRPPLVTSERLARLQAQLALRKSERNTMLRNGTVFNSQTRRRRNRGRVNRMYANMARIARTRSERERIQVKRDVARAKFNRLELANQTIQGLEQQVRNLQSRLPPSPPGTSASTLSSSNTANLVPNLPAFTAVP